MEIIYLRSFVVKGSKEREFYWVRNGDKRRLENIWEN